MSVARSLHVGLTYDLRQEYLARGLSEEETAELDRGDTIDAVDEALVALGHRVERIGGAEALVGRLLRGERWDLVFNISEGLYGLGRESLVPALLDHFRIPYTFSDPATTALTLHKAFAKRVVRDAGVATANFCVIERMADVERGVPLALPLFLKPIGEGTGKGCTPSSIVHTKEELAAACRELLAKFRQPVLVETLLPGRELTVGILGSGDRSRVVGTLDVLLRQGADPGVYSYRNKELCEELVDYVRVEADADPGVAEAEGVALAAWRALGCRDGGRVDVRFGSDRRCYFLEVNPLAGLHPEHSDLPILWRQGGGRYRDLIGAIVESARSRLLEAPAVPLPLAAAY